MESENDNRHTFAKRYSSQHQHGVFGKWDFLANAILFVVYHLHATWNWPSMLLYNWIRPWAAKRFKSYWVALLLHGFSDSIVLIVLFTMAIMGLP